MTHHAALQRMRCHSAAHRRDWGVVLNDWEIRAGEYNATSQPWNNFSLYSTLPVPDLHLPAQIEVNRSNFSASLLLSLPSLWALERAAQQLVHDVQHVDMTLWRAEGPAETPHTCSCCCLGPGAKGEGK